MTKMRTCPCCEHYETCKYWEDLLELNTTLGFAVDWMNDRKFWKWRERFAQLCMYFKLDEATVHSLVKMGLDFIYHSSPEKVNNNGMDKKPV